MRRTKPVCVAREGTAEHDRHDRLQRAPAAARPLAPYRDTAEGVVLQVAHQAALHRPCELGEAGLAITAIHLVQDHGGEVVVEQTSPEGTTFKVSVPLSASPANTMAVKHTN